MFHAYALRVGRVEAQAAPGRGVGGGAVEDQQVGIVETAEDQVKIAVAVDVRDADAVRP